MALTEEEIVAEVHSGHLRLAGLVADLTDEQVRAPSALPDWSRAHVLAHLTNLANAFVRQTEHALRDELIEVYAGGRPARDAAIESGARQTAAQLTGALQQAHAGLRQAWSALTPQDWARKVTYRDGDLRDVLRCHWREVEIHTTDLLLGYTPAQWRPDFSRHVIDFLGPRNTAAVAIDGKPADVAAWLAGRTSTGPVSARGAAELPELGPWP